MIIRKPYGFLIKNFKLINILLVVPMLYIALKFGDIAGFFSDFVSNDYKTIQTQIAGSYITVLTFIALISLILVNIIIYLLMHSKKKSTTYYAVNIIYYILLLVLTIIYYSIMSEIEIGSVLSSTFVDFIRDISFILTLPSYVLIFMNISKGVGFNFKTLKFDNNLNLRITEEDEEEIEIKLTDNNHVLKKNVIHTIRELRYYFLENKLIISLISIFVLVIFFVGLYMHFGVYNKSYNANQAFALDSFTLTLKDSYLTNIDYSGNEIAKDKYFLVVKMAINNKDTEAISLKSGNFKIFFDDKSAFPSYDRSSRFIDIGKPYYGAEIAPGEANDYVLVYELDETMLKAQYQMRIYSGVDNKNGKIIPRYKTINIKPKNIIKEIDMGNTEIGKEILFEDTFLGNTKYKLKKFEIADSYTYEYEYCHKSKECINLRKTLVPTSGNVLLIFKDEISWDENSPYYQNKTIDFYKHFTKLTYTYSRGESTKVYETQLKNVTPSGVTEAKIYEITNIVRRSTNSNLILQVRNKRATLNLKYSS